MKDLLYLRDLMAAGDKIVARIEDDVDEIGSESCRDADRIRTAATNLGFVVHGHLKHRLVDLGRMLMERSHVQSPQHEAAAAAGYLTDLHELLAEVADRYAPLPPEDFEEAD